MERENSRDEGSFFPFSYHVLIVVDVVMELCLEGFLSRPTVLTIEFGL